MSLHARLATRSSPRRAARAMGRRSPSWRAAIGRLIAGRHARSAGRASSVEDLRQEALLGLFDACRKHDPGAGAASRAGAGVRAQRASRGAHGTRARVKHRVLSDAVRDGDEPVRAARAALRRGAATDPGAGGRAARRAAPARVNAARQPLAERRGAIGARRYSDEQVDGALDADRARARRSRRRPGAVGASQAARVARWVKRAGARRAGRRRFTPDRDRARASRSSRTARRCARPAPRSAPSNATVLRWVRAGRMTSPALAAADHARAARRARRARRPPGLPAA